MTGARLAIPATNETLNARNAAYGPNLGCGPAITPLVAEKTRVHAALDGMGPWSRGGTQGNLGLVWGWAVLSPRWRGLWGGNTPNELPLDYNSDLSDKIVVMLTDGNNEVYDWLNKWDPNRNGSNDWCGYEKQNNYYGGNCPFGTTNTDPDFVGPRGSDYTSYGRLNDFPGAPTTDQRRQDDSRPEDDPDLHGHEAAGHHHLHDHLRLGPELGDPDPLSQLCHAAGLLLSRAGQRDAAHRLPAGWDAAEQPPYRRMTTRPLPRLGGCLARLPWRRRGPVRHAGACSVSVHRRQP